jgi:hypothetical protein
VIERLPDLARAVPLLQGAETLYEVDLSAVPSWEWRAAFLRPPARHSTSWSLAALDSATAVHFRTTPDIRAGKAGSELFPLQA